MTHNYVSLTAGAEEKSIKRKLGNLVNLSSSSNVAQEMSPKPTESHTASPKLNHRQAPSSSRSIFAKLKAAKQRCMSAAKMFGASENAMKTIFLQLKPWINVLILKRTCVKSTFELMDFPASDKNGLVFRTADVETCENPTFYLFLKFSCSRRGLVTWHCNLLQGKFPLNSCEQNTMNPCKTIQSKIQ